MKKVVNVQITRGERYYVAESLDLPFVTQGFTLDETIANVREAVDLTLADGDNQLFDMVANPSIIANIVVDSLEYA
jgi:predicted RNase H-like HicB family nuclease